MKYLVTGATGFIGRSLCAALRSRGDEVLALSRSGGPVDDSLTSIACDLAVSDLDETFLRGVDGVFHLAGIAHQKAPASAYAALNYTATLRLAQRACEAGVTSFVFLSSVKAMGSPTGLEARAEQDLSEPVGAYAQSKRQAEQALEEEFCNSAMSVLILRPTLVYGAQASGNLRQLVQAVQHGLPRPPSGGRRSMIALDDLVSLLCLIVHEPRQGVHTWIACGVRSYSTRQIYDLFRAALGKEPGSGWVPRFGWWVGATALDFVLRNRDESTYNKLFSGELYANQRVIADTGWQPATRLEDCVSALIAKAHK